MKIKMLGDVSGTREGQPWPARGETLNVGDDEGAALCSVGMAEPVADSKEERAVAPKATTRNKA